MIAIIPGSFDPFTLGHLDIVSRASALFSDVIVAVLNHPEKQALFSVEERINLIQLSLQEYKIKAKVDFFSGLLIDYVQKEKGKVIVRGLRAITDYDYEAQMALMNKSLDPNIETCFLVTKQEYSYISSTLVKQIAKYGGDISALVPSPVMKALIEKFSL